MATGGQRFLSEFYTWAITRQHSAHAIDYKWTTLLILANRQRKADNVGGYTFRYLQFYVCGSPKLLKIKIRYMTILHRKSEALQCNI